MSNYYLYKFINEYNEVIYVGQSKNLKKRVASHRADKIWFNEIHKIEYYIFHNKTDLNIYELYYINIYKPKYNNKSLYEERCTLELPELCFVEYDVSKVKPRVDALCTHRNSAIELNHKNNQDILDFYYKNEMNYKDWNNLLYNKKFMIGDNVYIFYSASISIDNQLDDSCELILKQINTDYCFMRCKVEKFINMLKNNILLLTQ